MNIATSVAVCFCWGYLLYTVDFSRLWLMMGVANQLLATIGLAVGTTYLLLHAPSGCMRFARRFLSGWWW